MSLRMSNGGIRLAAAKISPQAMQQAHKETATFEKVVDLFDKGHKFILP